MNRPPNGFTLIEVCLALAIFGVALAGAGFALGTAHHHLLKEEGRRLVVFIEDCMLETRLTNKPLTVTVSQHSVRASQSNSLTMLHTVTFTSRLNLKLEGKREMLALYPSGVSQPTSISISNALNTCHLTIGLRGRVALRCGTL